MQNTRAAHVRIYGTVSCRESVRYWYIFTSVLVERKGTDMLLVCAGMSSARSNLKTNTRCLIGCDKLPYLNDAPFTCIRWNFRFNLDSICDRMKTIQSFGKTYLKKKKEVTWLFMVWTLTLRGCIELCHLRLFDEKLLDFWSLRSNYFIFKISSHQKRIVCTTHATKGKVLSCQSTTHKTIHNQSVKIIISTCITKERKKKIRQYVCS